MTFITLDHIMELQQCYYVNVNALMSQTLAMMVEAEARLIRKLWDWSETEPKINKAEVVGLRPRQRAVETKTGKKTAARQDSCLKDYITLCCPQNGISVSFVQDWLVCTLTQTLCLQAHQCVLQKTDRDAVLGAAVTNHEMCNVW